MKKIFAALFLGVALTGPVAARQNGDFQQTVQKTTQMVYDQVATKLAAQHGLNIVNVTWEDTGRYKGSCVGPNISDMTLQVQLRDPRTDQYSLHCLPVIRYDNFSDKTADLKMDDFFLMVGNEEGEGLRRVGLRQYLTDLRAYMSTPKSWAGEGNSLLASERDDHVLVSAQACFLPIPKGGEVEFNPVLFTYQSYSGDPAVLTILATREGTSMTVIDNKRDGFATGQTWGQRLFFNQDGERAPLTGKRMSDFLAQGGSGSEKSVSAGGQEGLNMVLLIQVPLKQKNPMTRDTGILAECTGAVCRRAEASSTENAVIGHGKVEGPFTEIDDLAIERDDRFPIRVTVQFYKATENGVVSKDDMDSIAHQIDKVYQDATYVGSLVTEGETGRPTEYEGSKTQPPDWWAAFIQRYQDNIGEDWTGLESLWEELDLKAR